MTHALIHGFGFENESEDGKLDDFLAVFGDNAYICVGAFGLCATHVPDPLYWGIWLPVHIKWVEESGGSCVGMASTSQLMYHGDLSPSAFDANASFAAGITQQFQI